jgi:hypothetical protein
MPYLLQLFLTICFSIDTQGEATLQAKQLLHKAEEVNSLQKAQNLNNLKNAQQLNQLKNAEQVNNVKNAQQINGSEQKAWVSQVHVKSHSTFDTDQILREPRMVRQVVPLQEFLEFSLERWQE